MGCSVSAFLSPLPHGARLPGISDETSIPVFLSRFGGLNERPEGEREGDHGHSGFPAPIGATGPPGGHRHIGIIGPAHPFRGGIAHYTACLADSLKPRGHDVLVLNYRTLYPRVLFPGRTMMDWSREPIAFRSVRVVAPLLPWTWLRAVRRLVRFEASILVVQWWHVFFAPCLITIIAMWRLWTRRPAVVIMHNAADHDRSLLWTKIPATLLKWCGAAIIVHAQAEARQLNQLVRGLNVSVVAHPAYDVFAAKEIPDRRAAREALGFGDGPLCLFFGLVRAYKGLEDLLVAFSMLRDMPEVRLLVAGECYEPVERYRDLIEQLGIVERVEIRDRYVPNEEVAAYFVAADVLIAPYRSASQSGPVRIAQALHRPVIVSDAGGLPEMVTPEETGLVVPSRSPAELADAIRRFFREDLGPRFAANLETCSDSATWEVLIKEVERQCQGKSA